MTARTAASAFDAITIEGGLLPAEWLAKIAGLKAPQQGAPDYGVPKGLNLRDELGRYWRIANAHWQDFAKGRDGAADPRALATRFTLNLLRDVFGAADCAAASAPAVIDDHAYPVTALALGGRLPVAVGDPRQSLDQRDRAYGDTGRQRSAFGLLQDYLNAEDAALWGIACNGITLRVARDNASLTRPAWIEADLERIFVEDRFADFSLLWLVVHASRFGRAGQPPEQCPLEAWRNASREEGTRARDQLRNGVTQALLEIGQGFLAHPDNRALRAKLVAGELTQQAYFRQLLRLVYRLIFLLTIEERGLLHPNGAGEQAIKLYAEGYSLRRLTERARRRRAYDRHADLWQGLAPVFTGLAESQPLLALPALGGLFAAGQCPDLDVAQLPNRALLAALDALCWLRIDGALTRTNWRDMKYEEFGSVYESLLELVPDVTNEAHDFGFAEAEQARGNERKQTGSYYTPDDLVQQLLDSALEPVIEQRLAGAADPEAALLAITVCDPACGSGHFLLAAAFRLADRLARIRAGGTPGGDEYRSALRDVVNHCLYGVDMNPMALELARTALWLEAMTPDKPLGFLDHHLQCGDALLGVLDTAILDAGIPGDAYKPLTGDDKAVASELKKQNKIERTSWKSALGADDLFQSEHLAASGTALDGLPDDNLAAIDAKRAAWREAHDAAENSRLARLADLYVGAFLLPKKEARRLREGGDPATLPSGTDPQSPAIPSSRHLWAIANHQTADGLAAAEPAARTACSDARVFHWWLAFPQIHAAGGFAVLLANPPWERIKLQEQEFFASRNPDIAKARNKAGRGQRIQWLSEGMLAAHLNPDIEPSAAQARAEQTLYAEFATARRTAEASSAFAHASGKDMPGRYPLTGVGDVNTYALFAETFAQAVSKNGRAGFIVQSGIGTDDSTKRYFQSIVENRRLVSFVGFDNAKLIFPAVHPDTPFALVTLGSTDAPTRLLHYILSIAELSDPRRQFTLTPEEFALINPNTRTCPVFRSARDAELTKAIYRCVPVLIRESEKDADGGATTPEANPWGITFQRMFDMATDSGVFKNESAADRLPLYEAKMIHQFDYRWATYVPKAGEGVETADCTDAQKADPGFAVTPRYWVETNEVLARIARVPNDVRKAWLAVHQAEPVGLAEARAALWLALSQWIAGEVFRREVGDGAHASTATAKAIVAKVLARLSDAFPACAVALHAARYTTRKLETECPKWAARDAAAPLDDAELATLRRLAADAATDSRDTALLAELDAWMDRRSPRWLMGWRDITNATNERTVIASVVPRVGTGDTLLLMYPNLVLGQRLACLLGDQCSLVHDYVARQKVGGTHLKYHVKKQLPILPPDRYAAADLDFIVPRVLELTYTAGDLADWARDLGHTGAPFAWNPERRAQLRAELDATYARLYGLTRDELRYILDPADVMGADYPSETFRVLKKNEETAFGEYRTRRLVLAAWDALATGAPA